MRLRGLDPSRRYRRTDPAAGATAGESTGGALMAAGLPLFAEEPGGNLHVRDWLSEVQVWETVEE